MRLTAITLADLQNPALLRELVAMSESDMLERKRTAEPTTLAKVISGFANAAGGWLLLGIDDGGGLVGWRPKGRAHVRDWLRDVLDNHLDPAPPFDADMFILDGRSLGVVHVPRSSAAPHFMSATGEVFERRNGQTRRASAERVRQLTLRGAEVLREAALKRLDDRRTALDVAEILDAPRDRSAMHPRALASIVRASLVEPSEAFQAWVHTPAALETSNRFVRSAAQTMNDRGRDWFDPPQVQAARTTAGGHTAAAQWDGHILREVSVAWDGQGLAGVRFAGLRPDDSGVYYLLSDEVRDRWLTTALDYLLTELEAAGEFGPAILRWDLQGIRRADVTTVRDGNIVAAQGVIPHRYDNIVALNIQCDTGAKSAADVAHELWQQLERLAGSRTV